jgi:hypothetical protein
LNKLLFVLHGSIYKELRRPDEKLPGPLFAHPYPRSYVCGLVEITGVDRVVLVPARYAMWSPYKEGGGKTPRNPFTSGYECVGRLTWLIE